jgi:hypothetical protein
MSLGEIYVPKQELGNEEKNFQGSCSWSRGSPVNYEKTRWGGRPRPPSDLHRLESLCYRKNFLEPRLTTC